MKRIRDNFKGFQVMDGYKSIGYFFKLPDHLACLFPPHPDDVSPPHITYLIIGYLPMEYYERFLALSREFFSSCKKTTAYLSGLDVFDTPSQKIYHVVITYDSDMHRLQKDLIRYLEDHGIVVNNPYSIYNPHVTLEYAPKTSTSYDAGLHGRIPEGSFDISCVEIWDSKPLATIPFGDTLHETKC